MSDAVPTGCYKCGRPGHWSRDCPSSSSSSSNPNPNPNPKPSSFNNTTNSFTPSTSFSKGPKPAVPKPKKVPRTRPKLTPELLLSDEGLGYILRYFPRNFKYRGRGHEVSDLRNLLRMYAEWHSQFLPYFPFDQFIHKVEEVGSSRRVRACIADLKDRVANGGDPTKLNESAAENETAHEKEDVFNAEEPTHHQEDSVFNDNDTPEDMEEDVLNEVYNSIVDETSYGVQTSIAGADVPPAPRDTSSKKSEQAPKTGGSSDAVQLTEEQKTLMEAKRLRALTKAAATPHTHSVQASTAGPDIPPTPNNMLTENSDQAPKSTVRNANAGQLTEEQKAIMEAKRLKALEKAAARSRLLSGS